MGKLQDTRQKTKRNVFPKELRCYVPLHEYRPVIKLVYHLRAPTASNTMKSHAWATEGKVESKKG